MGRSIPDALLDFARGENVTQVVMGASTQSRWRHLTRGSVIQRIIRASGAIDVHVISHDAAPGGGSALRSERPTGLSSSRRLAGFVVAAVALALVTLVCIPFRERLNLSSMMLIYLCVVVGVAALGGMWPAIATAVAASLLINYYFTPPLHTWNIADAANVFGIVVFVLVGAVVSALVDLAASGRVKSHVSRVGALSELGAIFDELEGARYLGRAVVTDLAG